MKLRSSGILLHITSLPSPYGIGDLGKGAYRFADFLHETKQFYWQILPLNPTSTAFGNSPYSSPSAFAGNPLLISLEHLVEDNLLLKSDTEAAPLFPAERVEYQSVSRYKREVLDIAFENYKSSRLGKDREFDRFCDENSYWLEDYALFIALGEHFGTFDWTIWEEGIRDRRDAAVSEWKWKLQDRVLKEKFLQFIFFRQVADLKRYCNERNISIFGDIPIYVNFESSDVWTNPEIFKLDEDKKSLFVAGVPPDYFSDTGQLWGNPVYRWDVLGETGYEWWIDRMEHNLALFDLVRLDHFRGFVGYWEVPAGEDTALNGSWVEVPADDFFDTLFKRFIDLPVVAEDLGVITPDVREVMDRFKFPGMKLLMFAFGDDFPDSDYLPHNYGKNCVVYSGTHDNNTVRGWWNKEASAKQKERVFRYRGMQIDPNDISLELVRLGMSSIANTAIFPMQDILGLGEQGRMNTPATSKGNWEWRITSDVITDSVKARLLELTEIYGRG